MNKDKLELLKFKQIEAEDLNTIRNYLRKYKYETCDYNLVNLFTWGHFLNVRWKIYKDRLLFFNFTSEFMLYPLGDTFTALEIKELSDLIKNEGYPGNFVSVPEDYLTLNPAVNDNFTPVYDEGNSDYLYLSEELAVLSGKKLHKKKNLVSQFKRNYSFRIERFGREYIESCVELSVTWCKETSEVCDEERQLELNVLKRALIHHEILELDGILLFSEDKLAGFALFSGLGDNTADIHFEKYDPKLKGSGQIINQETALFLKERYKYLNREQDLGKEGLRKAKLSYAPERLIPTYKLIRS